MRILLAAINAKYIHSNLAVYSLKASAGKYEEQVELAEYTINQQPEEIFAAIYRTQPELLLFSCYIWNRREVAEAADSIKKVLPFVRIWAGGPEVSYDAAAFLRENPQFDGVMLGEGERTFYRLLQYYVDGIGTPEEIPGITWRETAKRRKDPEPGALEERNAPEDGLIRMNPQEPPCTTLDGIPFVYRDMSRFENRIIYYESSRGCPFSCSYCLSSIDKRVRFRSLELVKEELTFFLEKRVKQVKFVDRTFNCSHHHAQEIWRHIRDRDNGVTNFHFEISADLLNEEEFELLSTMRPGLVQLEIGVQTTNEDALRAIHRSARFEKIAAAVNRVARARNIHQHLDLIAGLPYEDFESFRSSFDDVYRLRPQELQLGFLKVLKGSEMERRAEEYGILSRGTPPYEVLATRWIGCGELLRLKEIEEMLEVYYNSGQFVHTIQAAEQLFDRPIEVYEALADYYKEENLTGKAYSRMQRLEILRGFLHKICRRLGDKACGDQREADALPEESSRSQEEIHRFDELLLLDLYLRENAKTRPEWAPSLSETKDEAIRFYKEEEQTHGHLPHLAGMTWKQMMRMTHLERFDTQALGEEFRDGSKEIAGKDSGIWLLFDYSRRDPLTYDARIEKIIMEKT